MSTGIVYNDICKRKVHVVIFFHGSFCQFDHFGDVYVQHQEHTFFHILINPKQDRMYHL